MDFLKKCVNEPETIDPSTLEGKDFFMWLSIDKYLNYTIPKSKGEIVYNKEFYGEYCRMFKDAIKSGTILPNMKTMEIYEKLPYPNLDKWTKIKIIRKLKDNETDPIVASPILKKMDKEYIDEIIENSHSIMSSLSKISPLLELMKMKNLKQEDVIQLILEKYP